MYSLAVMEEAGGKMASIIEDNIKTITKPPDGGFVIVKSEEMKNFHGKYQLVILSEKAAKGNDLTQSNDIMCDILLAPGEYASKAAESINAKYIVSYGMSVRDTITMSSIGENDFVMALQRELVTLGGNILDRQELPIHCKDRLSADKIMAIYGSLLMIDFFPNLL